MTNNDAIRILTEQKNKFLDEWVDYGGVAEAYNMAINALKTDAHIMTIEEVENAIDTVVWIDRPNLDNSSDMYALVQAYSRKHKIVQLRFIDMLYDDHADYFYETYGTQWRCWNKRPTEEQRQEVKWK